MTDTSTPSRYRLGLIHEYGPPKTADLAAYATAPLPPPAAEVAVPSVPGGFPMADNDRLGDCTIAGGPVHADQVWRALTQMPYSYPGDAAVQDAYFGLTGGPDTGLPLSTVCEAWRKGLLGSTIDAYAPVNPKDLTAVKQAVEWFGACYVGVNLPAVAQQQFDPNGEGTWELTGTDADYQIEGGHCVLLVGYASNLVAVTWGSTVFITPQWWYTYGQSAFALIPVEFEEHGGDTRGIPIAHLVADLNRV